MFVTQLILSVGAVINFKLSVTDVHGTFMKLDPIKRDLYVRPLRQMPTPTGPLGSVPSSNMDSLTRGANL